MDTPLDSLPAPIQDRITELTCGTASTLEDALDQWTEAIELIGHLNEQNDRYESENRRLIFLARLGKYVIDRLALDAGLFAKPATHQKVRDFLDHYNKLQEQIPQLVEPPF